MSEPQYRGYLQQAVSQSAAPYGYTLTMWTSGAVTIQTEGKGPSTVDALLLLLGAVLAFTLVGLVAYGGWRREGSDIATPAPVWAGIHIPSVGLSVLACSLIAHLVSGHLVWGLVGLSATTIYLVALAAQQEITRRITA